MRTAHSVSHRVIILISRTNNIFEKLEGPCVNINSHEEPTFENVCKGIRSDQQLITYFNDNYVPLLCRSSLEGVWQFAYQNRFRFTGECDNPDAKIQSCQTGMEEMTPQ